MALAEHFFDNRYKSPFRLQLPMTDLLKKFSAAETNMFFLNRLTNFIISKEA